MTQVCGQNLTYSTYFSLMTLDTKQRQRIIAMVCSDPPEGRARWTVRLIAEEAVKRKLAPQVGRETIRVLLLSHDFKPWREKNVVGARTQ
jgi:putative transposase